jgi:flagellar biosynthesis protein FlhG
MQKAASDQAEGIRLTRNEAGLGRPPSKLLPTTTRTIAVTSGKGGVGKTQISANLAVSLAQKGRRVLLLDADVGLASLDLAFGVRPRADLLSVLRGQSRVEDILIDTPSGVQLLPACPGRYEMANMTGSERERLMAVLRQLAARYDVWLIDTGAGIGSNSVGFAAAAEEVVMVATPDPSSLRDAYAMAKVLHRRCGIDRISLVANQVAEESEGIEVFERLDNIVRRFLSLEIDYLGSVPRDESVVRAVARGEPYVLGAPRSRAALAMVALARKLAPARNPSPADASC